MDNFIKLAAVPDYVFKITGVGISRQTVYNWASKGRCRPKISKNLFGNPVYLQIRLRAGQLFTTEEWVRKFLKEIGE